jgi:hypothetical protein
MLSHALVPGLATSTAAEVWVAAMSLNERPAIPAGATIVDELTGTATPVAQWTEWLLPDQGAGVVFARVAVQGLPPRVRRRMQLVIGGQAKASGFVTTLPDRVPGVEDRPLTLMIGSCFCRAEDRAGRAGRVFAGLPDALRPDLKLLTGDQVYLDSPFFQFLIPHTKQGLAEMFLQKYVDTWTQTGDLQGFQQILSSGAAVFTSDDHEFWNNAPFPSFSVNTWTQGGRDTWFGLASGLLAAFQQPDPASAVRLLQIGDLSMFVADTRARRSADRKSFLPAVDMQRLVAWVRGLTFPGILVLGQPIFAKKAGIQGNIADWNLPDFTQYEELCRVLLQAPQPIVMLTGDVHYGRVARIVTSAQRDLFEIIASPMSLVTGGGERRWTAPPNTFPAEPIPGAVSRPIEVMADWKRAQDHFLTLELWQQGSGLRMRVRSWETDPDGTSPSSPVFEHTLPRAM